MANNAATDQRLRRRISTIIGAAGLSAKAITTRCNPDILFANRHYITVVPQLTPPTLPPAALTGGVFSIRGEPVATTSTGTAINNVAGFAPIGIEAIDVTTATVFTFVVSGFFDAFMVSVDTAVTGGKIVVVINSTIEN